MKIIISIFWLKQKRRCQATPFNINFVLYYSNFNTNMTALVCSVDTAADQ